MTEAQPKPSDQLYHAIAALRGWDEVADEARSFGRAHAWRLGQLVSSVLVSAGDDRAPLAVTGALDEHGTGNLAVIYDNFIVVGDVVELSKQTHNFAVSVHSFHAIDDIRVSTTHNYFDGTEQHARHEGIELRIGVAGQQFTFPPSRWGHSPLLRDDAVRDAYAAIRDRRSML